MRRALHLRAASVVARHYGVEELIVRAWNISVKESAFTTREGCDCPRRDTLTWSFGEKIQRFSIGSTCRKIFCLLTFHFRDGKFSGISRTNN